MSEAVELCLLVGGGLGRARPLLVRDALLAKADRVLPLAMQAALGWALAQIAEALMDELLSDPVVLGLALDAAAEGDPLTAARVGGSASALLAQAGLAAARLRA